MRLALIAKYGKPTKENEKGIGWFFKDSLIFLGSSEYQSIAEFQLVYINNTIHL